MAPSTLREQLTTLATDFQTFVEKAIAADVRTAERLTALEAWQKEQADKPPAPTVPDTAWSALVALVRVAGQDAITVRLLVGGTLAALLILGLATLALLNEHPELIGVVGGQ